MMHGLRRFFGFFASRAFWILVGVVALALCIWFAGPLFAFDDHRPMESVGARRWLIAALLALYALWWIASFWRRRRISGKLFEHIGRIRASVDAQRSDPEVSPEVLELQTRFSDAAKALRSLRVPGKTRSSLWGRKFIYELPWYIIIGAPGSGKTTALVHSGLDFPLANRFGKLGLQGIGGTRHCDWWFTDQAVVIDTAGRYTTQDSNQEADKTEWLGFLGLLKQYRPRQLVNGVMLTLSVSDLLTYTNDELLAHLTTLRERLNELQTTFAVELPVYLWVTKVDLLAGFNEFFGAYSTEQRNQIWGFTFPYSDKAASNRPTKAAFDSEWSALQTTLFSMQNAHLASELDQRRRNYIYAFPQQFAGLHARLEQAIDFVFSESRLMQQPLLRGVYFSSGTQEGTVFDRVLGSMRRQVSSAGQVPVTPHTNGGKSYFLHDLLVKLIFAESHLAGRNAKWERRARVLTYVGYGLSLMLLVGAIGAWMLSHDNNRQYLARAGQNADGVSQSLEHFNNDATDLGALLRLLGQVNHIGDGPEFQHKHPPLTYRYGLYQGEKVSAATRHAYERMLESGLLPFAARRLEAQLQNPPADDLEYLYEALKAYLMLQQAERYSPEHMRHWLGMDFKRVLLPEADPQTAQAIDKHLAALFSQSRVVSSPYPRNDALVNLARVKLSALSASQRAYYRLRSSLLQKDLREFGLLDAAGPQAANVFTRKSGQPLNRGVPGLFTYQGYWDVFDKSVNGVMKEVSDDEGWVMGLPAQNVAVQLGDAMQGKLVREVRLLFLREYQQTWAQYLQDVVLIPGDSLQSSIQRMRVLSAPDSPLPLFIRSVVKETTLLREPDKGQQTVVDKVANKIKNTRNDLERVVGPVAAAHTLRENKDERIVDDYFEPLRRLVGAPGQQGQGSFPIDALLKTLDEYYGTLMAADAAQRSGGTPPPNDSVMRLKAEASRLPAPLGQMLGGIANSTSREIMTMGHARVDAELRANVGDFCRQAVAGRYPLNRAASNEVTPQDFARLFGSGGLMDDFFNRQLAPIVDTTTWTYKKNIDGSSAGGGANLGAFQKAGVIKNVFFSAGDAIPRLRIEMKVVEMDSSISNMALDVDGTVLRYAHGPQLSQPVPWPGPRGRQQVSLQITDQNGGQSALSTEGAWALHRFIDKAQITAGSRPGSFNATVVVNDRKVVFEVTAGSVQNPFRLSQLQSFSCPG